MYSVLYTDDEPGLLDLGKIFLEQSGSFSVETAISVQDSFAALKKRPVDCIVSDYQMPGTDGIVFLKEVRKHYGDIPFILFTGRGREEVVIEAINNGVDFYLQKGGDPLAQFVELSHKIRLAVERRKTLKALEESEEKYRSLVDLVPDAVLVHRDGEVVYVNPECVRLVGAGTPDDLIGRNLLPYIHPDDRPMAVEHLRLLKEKGITIPLVEERLLRMDGRPFTVEITAKPVIYQGLPSVIVVFRDITERKKREDELMAAYEQITAAEEELRSQYEGLARGEQQLRESRELLRSFLDSATDAFTIWDAGLNLIDINHAALSFLPAGTRKEEVIGKNIAEFMSGSDEWGMRERYLEVIRTGIPFTGTGKMPDPRFGGRHWLNVKCFRVGSGLGIMTTDVSREKESEEELRRSEEKYRHILEHMQDAYIRINEKGIITMTNASAACMYGYGSAGEMNGLDAGILAIRGQDRKELLRILENDGDVTNFLGTAVRKDGASFPVSVNVQVLRDSRGRVRGREAIVRDLSEAAGRGPG